MLYIISMCIFLFFVFANDITCCVFIFTLKYGKDVRQEQILAIFLFEFKMGPKAVEMTHSINKTFGPGTANLQ